MTDLHDHFALVTGGARGIGAAVSRALAQAGARVLAVDVREEELARLSASAEGRIETFAADIRDLDRIAEHLNGLAVWPDMLINNAAIAPRCPVLELDRETLAATLDVNLLAPVLLTRLIGERLLAESRPGAVVNVASVNAYRGHADLLHYNASKAAMLSVTRTLAAAWGRQGIRVNAVVPGSTWTDIWPEGGFTDEDRITYGDKNPLGRFAIPEEIAATVLFLVSADAAFVNGAELVVDGGLTSAGA